MIGFILLTLLLIFFISFNLIDHVLPLSKDRTEGQKRNNDERKASEDTYKTSRNGTKKKDKIVPGCFFLSILLPADTLVEKLESVCSFGKVLPSQKEA